MKVEEYEQIKERLAEIDEEIVLFDGLEDALIGVCRRFNQPPVAIYDYEKCIEVLMRDGGTYDEAQEHLEFNTCGAWVGEYTPAFFSRLPE